MYIYPGINNNQINNRMLGSYYTYICIITAYYGVFGGKLKVFILVMVYYTSTSCFPFSVLNAIILCNWYYDYTCSLSHAARCTS